MKIEKFIGKTLVALSGGADSVALFCLLCEQGADIEALHCNFHLRGEESNRDEMFVSSLCKKYSIRLHIKHFETNCYAKEKGISTEMAARELRYQWFEEMRKQRNAERIAVAHHRDDQAETLLLNLIRGTGLRGLAGMSQHSGHIVRPLLPYSRKEIMNYLDSIRQDYVTDSTNAERDAQRNRIRLDVMPLLEQINPQAARHIAETAERVRLAFPYYLKGVNAENELNATTLHERLRGMGFTVAQQESLLAALQNGTSGRIFESATHRALANRGHLEVEKKSEDKVGKCEDSQNVALEAHIETPEHPIEWLRQQSLTPEFAYLDADKLCAPLTLRHPQAGDRFCPLGMKGRTRLLSDFLTDHKLSLFQKQRQWVVTMGDDIVWVCGLRPDHRFRITEATKRIMLLSVITPDK